jgi:hypothetical protein
MSVGVEVGAIGTIVMFRETTQPGRTSAPSNSARKVFRIAA